MSSQKLKRIQSIPHKTLGEEEESPFKAPQMAVVCLQQWCETVKKGPQGWHNNGSRT